MKKIIITGFFFTCMWTAFFFFGMPPAFSGEKDRSFAVPPLSTEKPSEHSGGVKVFPVKPGEKIPDWVARLELARILSYVKRYDESVIEYEKVLKEKPDLMEARVEISRVLFWKGDLKTAVETLKYVPPEDMNGDTKVLMADLFMAQKDYAKAEPFYKAYLDHHPADHAVRLKLAEMLSWQKKYDASLNEYRNILKVSPDDIQVRRRYAFVLIWAGKHREAASELKKTLH